MTSRFPPEELLPNKLFLQCLCSCCLNGEHCTCPHSPQEYCEFLLFSTSLELLHVIFRVLLSSVIKNMNRTRAQTGPCRILLNKSFYSENDPLIL